MQEILCNTMSDIYKRIEKERGSDDLRTAYKMTALLMFYFIHCNRVKPSKNLLKEDINFKKPVKVWL